MSVTKNIYKGHKLAMIVCSTLLSIKFKLLIIMHRCDLNTEAILLLVLLRVIWYKLIVNKISILLGFVALLLGL